MAKTTLLEAHCKCFDFKLYIFLLYISPITIIPFTWFRTWKNSSAISILSCLHPKFIRLQYAKNFRCKGRFLSESEIDISNCQTHMPNHYPKVEILKLSSITVKCCISVSVLNFIHQDVKSPNNVYLFRLLTTLFLLSFVLSSKVLFIFRCSKIGKKMRAIIC